MRGVLRDGATADVPCGTCTACCTSSQFVHIEPDEADALAAIPSALLFPAPGLPEGHVLLGYDEKGHCPMLQEGACSIYEHRPRTCRAYDCRIFPATGVQLTGGELPLIAEQAGRWRFTHPEPADAVEHDALQRSAAFLRSEARAPGPTSTQLAVLAVEAHEAFVTYDEFGQPSPVVPDAAQVRAELDQRGRRSAT